jgi:DNA-binding protein HU-beta
MTKSDLSNEMAKLSGKKAEDCQKSVEQFMDVVKASLRKGEPVFLRGFGTFLPKKQAAKKARNIKLGTTIEVPARTVPSFKPSDEFKQMMAS